jgi:hypothetical protein
METLGSDQDEERSKYLIKKAEPESTGFAF